MSKPILYVDMDGVIADFDVVIKQMFGISYWKIVDRGMWEAIHKIQHFYRDLPKMPDADLLWDHVQANYSARYEIQILTAIPRRISCQHAEQDKRDWIAEHFGKDIIVKIGPYSHDKQKHARVGDILIDDRKSNIEQWNAKGAIGILHTSAAESIKILDGLHA